MRRAAKFVVLMFFCISQFVCLAADLSDLERGSPEDAAAMVRRVIASLKTRGRDKTFAEVTNGIYINRDVAISIVDFDGRVVAVSKNQKLRGKIVVDVRDQDGKYFVRDALELVKSQGKGWIDHKWPDPITGKIVTKHMYVESVDGLMVASGSFKG